MGSSLVTFYKEKVKTTWKVAFYSAFVIGLLVHLYKFMHYFPYFDGLYNYYSSQDMLEWGRWFLSAACAMTSYFDLPWLIGVVSVIMMALTAAIITEVLGIEDPVWIILSSGLLVSFPAITGTFFFEYTADGYILAMLLSSLAVLLSVKGPFCWQRFFAASACVCISCGIYQSYLSFTMLLLICYFLDGLLDNKYTLADAFRWILYQAGMLIVGVAVYFAIWRILLAWRDTSVVDYQGIGQIGDADAMALFSAVKNSALSFLYFLFDRNPLKNGWSLYTALNCLCVAGFGGVFLIAAVKSGLCKRKMQLLLSICCLFGIPFACCVCYFVSEGVYYATRMMQSAVLLYIFLGVLWHKWMPSKVKVLGILLLTAVIWNQTLMANICYLYMDRSYERSYSVAQEIATRIHMEDDGNVKYIAFYGSLDTVAEDADLDNSQLGMLGPLKNVYKADLLYYDHIALFMCQYLDFTLAYYRETGELEPLMELPPGSPVPKGTRIHIPLVEGERQAQINESPEVAAMGIWPGKDSVKRLNDVIVVKFSESE